MSALITEKIARNTMCIPWPYSLEDAESWLEGLEPNQVLGIFLPSHQLIGAVEWAQKDDDEIGFWVTDAHAGQGYATEAVRAAIAHTFTNTAVTNVSSSAWAENQGSQNVHLKAGFEEVGRTERFWRNRQQNVPVVLYSLTRERWLQLNRNPAIPQR
jgi:RimJ/RimL family protein N-acetyltransferase